MEINIVKNHQKNRPARGYVKGLTLSSGVVFNEHDTSLISP